MIDNLLYAKLSPHVKQSTSVAYLKNGTSDQIFAHIENKKQFSSLQNKSEFSIPTMIAASLHDISKKLSNPKLYAFTEKNEATLIRIAVRG